LPLQRKGAKRKEAEIESRDLGSFHPQAHAISAHHPKTVNARHKVMHGGQAEIANMIDLPTHAAVDFGNPDVPCYGSCKDG
jgi:hypothetical protein